MSNQSPKTDKPREYEEIVAELYRMLYGTDEPSEEVLAEGRVRTLTYDQLREISRRRHLTSNFYMSLQWETEESGVIIGYGTDAVLVGTDSNHSPLQAYTPGE